MEVVHIKNCIEIFIILTLCPKKLKKGPSEEISIGKKPSMSMLKDWDWKSESRSHKAELRSPEGPNRVKYVEG